MTDWAYEQSELLVGAKPAIGAKDVQKYSLREEGSGNTFV